MRGRSAALAVSCVLLCGSPSSRGQAVPQSISLSAFLEEDGTAMVGPHDFRFSLWPAESGGAAPLWEVLQPGLSLSDGHLETQLPVPSAVFTGATLFLEIEVDGTVLAPRVGVTSVPYAMRAGAVGPLEPDDLQQRITDACGAGFALTAVAQDGTVTCSPVVSSIATTGASGVAVGGTASAPTLALIDCPAGQAPIDQSGASRSYQCGIVGDITSVTPATNGGLSTGGTMGTQGDISLSLQSCPTGQVLKANAPGAGWSCAADADSAAVRKVGHSGLPVPIQSTSLQTVKSVTANFTAGGQVMVTFTAELENFDATVLLCEIHHNGSNVRSFSWDAGDADGQADLMQTVIDVFQVSAGSHTFALLCRVQTVGETARAHQVHAFLQYFPKQF